MTYEHRQRNADQRRMIDGLERLTNENQRLRRQLRDAMRIAEDALGRFRREAYNLAPDEPLPRWIKLRDEIAADDAARKAGR